MQCSCKHRRNCEICDLCSMPDGELLEFTGGLVCGLIDIVDIAVHLAAHVAQKLLHLFIGAFDQQLDAAIRQIADVSADVVLHCQILHGISESHALHAPGVMAKSPMRCLCGRAAHGSNISQSTPPTKINFHEPGSSNCSFSSS